MKFLRIILIFALFSTLAFLAFFHFIADILDQSTQEFLKNHSVSEATRSAKLALELNPEEPAYYKTYAQVLIFESALDTSKNEALKRKALENLKISIKKNPNNLATLRNTLPLYYYLSIRDLTKPPTIDNVDSAYLEEFLTFSRGLVSYAPTDTGVLVDVAEYYKKLGLMSEYEDIKRQVNFLRPDLIEWHPVFVE